MLLSISYGLGEGDKGAEEEEKKLPVPTPQREIPRSVVNPPPVQWPVSSHPVPCSVHTPMVGALELSLPSNLLQLHPSIPSPKIPHQRGALRQQGRGVREQGVVFFLKSNVSESPESQKREEAL